MAALLRPITSVAPDTSSATGATLPAVLGCNLTDVSAAKSCTLDATNIKVLFDTLLKTTAPAQARVVTLHGHREVAGCLRR
jgi:hypothetical protein